MTAKPGTQSIVVDYELPHPPEKVWRALTEPELLASWLMSNDIRPVVGHRFTMRDRPVPGWDGTVHCEVLVADPPRKFSFTWRGGSAKLEGGYGHTLDTVVTWTLTPTAAGGTRLHLAHDGFAQGSFAYEAMSRGWRSKVAERMAEVLAKAA